LREIIPATLPLFPACFKVQVFMFQDPFFVTDAENRSGLLSELDSLWEKNARRKNKKKKTA